MGDTPLPADAGSCHLSEVLDEVKVLLDGVEDPLVDEWDPLRLGLLLAKMEYDDLNIEAELEKFDGLAVVIREKVDASASLKEQTAQFVKVFSEDLGFRGDKANYYNLKNSFLNDVLLRRKGIPISVCLAFMGLASRVGIQSVGISFPGHFLVRVVPSRAHFDVASNREGASDWTEQWFVDVFDGGKMMTVADCEARLKEWTRGALAFGPESLSVAHPRDIFSRMLRNLRALLMEKEDLARLYWVLTALIETCPKEKVDSFKDRGLLFARMGRFTQAKEDFRRFLDLCVDSEKRAQVEGIMRFFENRSDTSN